MHRVVARRHAGSKQTQLTNLAFRLLQLPKAVAQFHRMWAQCVGTPGQGRGELHDGLLARRCVRSSLSRVLPESANALPGKCNSIIPTHQQLRGRIVLKQIGEDARPAQQLHIAIQSRHAHAARQILLFCSRQQAMTTDLAQIAI